MAKAKQGHRAYSGELARPVWPVSWEELIPYALTLGELGTGKLGLAHFAQERIAERLNAKFPFLFKHFNLEEGNYPALAAALALRHVPGFSVAKGRPGAKQRWTPFEVALLRFHIETTRSERPNRSFSEAARLVAKRGHWNKRLRPSTNPGETLRRRACSAQAHLVQKVRAAFSKAVADYPTRLVTPEQFVRDYLAMNIRIGDIGPEAISA